jgi:hypothetical protein
MPNFQQAFSTLSDTDYLMDAAKVGGGYMGGVLAKALVEGRFGQDLPDPVYGVGVAAGGAAMGQMEIAMGGGAYSAIAGARAAGVESTAVSALGGGSA